MGYVERGDFIYYEINMKCSRSLHFTLLTCIARNGVKHFGSEYYKVTMRKRAGIL